jgi:hypothetical protein
VSLPPPLFVYPTGFEWIEANESLGLLFVTTNDPEKLHIKGIFMILTNIFTFHASVLWGESTVVIIDVHISTCSIIAIELCF